MPRKPVHAQRFPLRRTHAPRVSAPHAGGGTAKPEAAGDVRPAMVPRPRVIGSGNPV